MEGLSFGEQVKIMLSRKNMTIKELAKQIQKRTGKTMSRQNLTQRLGRDNFQEKDMRMIASILGCPFRLSIFPEDLAEDGKILENKNAKTQVNNGRSKDEGEDGYQQTLVFDEEPEKEVVQEKTVSEDVSSGEERDMTIGELYEIHEELTELEEEAKAEAEEAVAESAQKKETKTIQEAKPKPKKPAKEVITPDSEKFEPVIKHDDIEEDLELGEMNPYTGREYQTNSVRMHPTRIGYVQVYDRKNHQWTDMTEWAFLGYQERKKALLGRDYEPPIYLD